MLDGFRHTMYRRQPDLPRTATVRGLSRVTALLARGVLLGAIAAGCAAAPAAAQERPNIIVVMTDDQGYGDFGFAGSPDVRTPNLDAMAAGSARMRNFYVSPVCAPTRASLLTGRYNYRTGVVDTYLGRAMMHPEEITIAEMLVKEGYATGIFGKWHLGDTYPMRPMDQGFEEALVHRGGGIGQPSDPPGGEGRYTDPILFHNGQPTPLQGYVTDVVFDAAMKWLEEAHRREEPFFAYIATNAPHTPLHDVPEEEYAYYRKRLGTDEGADKLARIYAMITNIDANVGRLFTRLDALGLTENTIVVFLTDNGPNTRRYVGDMRGMKGEVYEGGIRTPLLVHWPGRLEPGSASDRIAAHIDVLPTLLDAVGVVPPPDHALDGRSLLPLLERRPVDWPDRRIFVQSHRGDAPRRYHHFAVRSQRWKLLNNSGFGRHALPPGPPDFELYDIRHDPGETQNLVDRYPDVAVELREAYDRWFDDVSTTRPENYAPLRLHVGTPHENPVVLTRQDWRYDGDQGGWERNALGYWLLHVVDEGPYELRVRFDPEDASGTLRIGAGSVNLSSDVDAGAGSVTFESVRLPKGDIRLDAFLTHENLTRGVHQIDVIKTQ